jgi:hypothetical protein
MENMVKININTGRYAVLVECVSGDIDMLDVVANEDISTLDVEAQTQSLLDQVEYPMDSVVSACALPLVETQKEAA